MILFNHFIIKPKLKRKKINKRFKIFKGLFRINFKILNQTFYLKNKKIKARVYFNYKKFLEFFKFYKFYFLYLYYTKNNFFLNLNNLDGKLIYQLTAGKTGLKGKVKKTFYAYQTALKLLNYYLKVNHYRFIFLVLNGKLKSKLKLIYRKIKHKNKMLVLKSVRVVKFNHSKGLRMKKMRRL